MSVKVADALGQTDVSQVLAAIDWVVQHQNDNGMNIRVLNLSYGTDSNQSYVLDPVAYAAEQAWLHGIVVVVAAGNQGNWSNGLDDPAIDPYVIAVGASNTANTMNVRYHRPAAFTSEGDGTRNPDLSAPGTHIVSLRDPGSFVDDTFGSTATVSDRFFLGSGTSQAAAVVSGAAALLLSQRPDLTPDQVKALLDTNTHQMYGPTDLKGSGELNLAGVLNAPTPNATQTWPTSNGGNSNGRWSPAAPPGPARRGPDPHGRARPGPAPRGRGPRGPGRPGQGPRGRARAGPSTTGASGTFSVGSGRLEGHACARR